MIGLLQERELGGISITLEKALIARQTTRAGIGQRDWDTHSPVTWLDVDASEEASILAGDTDGSITATDLFSRELSEVFRVDNKNKHAGPVSSVSWYPFDSGVFFSSSTAGSLKVFDSNKVTCVLDIPLGGAIMTQAVSSSGRRLLVAVGGEFPERLRLCDIRTSSPVHTLSGHAKPVFGVDWNPGSEFVLASASEDGMCLLWDIRKSGILGKLGGGTLAYSPFKVATYPLTSVKFSPDAQFIFTFDTAGVLRRWDALSLADTIVNFPRMPRVADRGPLLQLAISGNGDIVYLPHQKYIRRFLASTGKELQKLAGHLYFVRCCSFAKARLELVSGGDDNHVLVWTASKPSRSREDDDFDDL